MNLTEFLAIYGAGLSTAVFAWNIAQARSRLRVRLVAEVTSTKDGAESGVGIFVQNPSRHTAHVTGISILYQYRRTTVWQRLRHRLRYISFRGDPGWVIGSLSAYGVADGCPVAIEPGHSHHVFVQQDAVERVLEKAISRQIRASVQDALWRNKRSKLFECVTVKERSA